MFSLLAIVVTILVLGSAAGWRAIRALSRSQVRSRAIRRSRSRGGGSLIKPAAVSRVSLESSKLEGHVSSTSSTRRW